MHAGLELERHRQFVSEHRTQVSHSGMQLHCRSHSAQLVVLMSRGYAEQTDDLLTERVIQQAAVSLRDFDGRSVHAPHQLFQLRSVQMFDQRCVVGQQ